jgi:hypothetical protein
MSGSTERAREPANRRSWNMSKWPRRWMNLPPAGRVKPAHCDQVRDCIMSADISCGAARPSSGGVLIGAAAPDSGRCAQGR